MELSLVDVEQPLSLSCNSTERACSTPPMRNSLGLLPQGYFERNTYKS